MIELLIYTANRKIPSKGNQLKGCPSARADTSRPLLLSYQQPRSSLISAKTALNHANTYDNFQWQLQALIHRFLLAACISRRTASFRSLSRASNHLHLACHRPSFIEPPSNVLSVVHLCNVLSMFFFGFLCSMRRKQLCSLHSFPASVPALARFLLLLRGPSRQQGDEAKPCGQNSMAYLAMTRTHVDLGKVMLDAL